MCRLRIEPAIANVTDKNIFFYHPYYRIKFLISISRILQFRHSFLRKISSFYRFLRYDPFRDILQQLEEAVGGAAIEGFRDLLSVR